MRNPLLYGMFLAIFACPLLANVHALAVKITRDDWGIPHIHGRTDADAVFGMMYAQAEDDFKRIETNYLRALGREALAEGEKAIWSDLRARLYVDEADLKARYAKSPHWLRELMDAWADGLNFFLATHPGVKPRVIKHFEPWMTLSFSEGSIGGDIESIDLAQLSEFYGEKRLTLLRTLDVEPRGSNGFAIAPQNTKNGHALLWINPHTTFYFRSEAQVTSDEGLNVYGASTWGQFFVYQGFNAHAGWMHTSSGVDAVDEFAETIENRKGRLFYRYGSQLRPLRSSIVVIGYLGQKGAIEYRRFTIYRTHHGPIVREQGGKWISVAMMEKPVEALEQSYLRTRAHDLSSFLKVARRQANSSNNTVFADDKGEIAYLHPQFIPKRNDRFDYSQPVDGADPATDWQGIHSFEETPHVVNPATGIIVNTNNWPYSAAGADSPKQENYPRYMDKYGENYRGIHAWRVLDNRKDFTVNTLTQAAFDSYLPAFAELIPGLVKAYDEIPNGNIKKGALEKPIEILRRWDFRWSADSIATTLAVLWGDTLVAAQAAKKAKSSPGKIKRIAESTTAQEKVQGLMDVIERLRTDFGDWRMPWGEVNRFQHPSDDAENYFSDKRPSLPVSFVSGNWGSLASYGARRYPGTKRYYGNAGNSFVAVVEFGDKPKAYAVSIGGQSGDMFSPHFNDQASTYLSGKLRPVYFFPEELNNHVERIYRPGYANTAENKKAR